LKLARTKQLDLFTTKPYVSPVDTNGYPNRASLNYIGSKYRLLPFISQIITETVGDLSNLVMAELFAGTGMVAKRFKGLVRQLIVNDLEHYSYVINRNYIGNCQPFEYIELVAELNALPGQVGFIYHHYCPGGGVGRQYFSNENGQKIDAIRQTIEAWYTAGRIKADQYYFLLATLLESADRVANVASVYGAYLKHLKKSAQKALLLKPATFQPDTQTHQVYQADANSLIKRITGDILYLDPPYNARQYGANYHLLNTIAKYDSFTPKGKTGLPTYQKSDYCKKGQVTQAFAELIEAAQFKYIFLSYNNEGLMSVETVREIMSGYGDYTLKTTRYQRFKADTDENRNHKADHTEEYLHVLVKK